MMFRGIFMRNAYVLMIIEALLIMLLFFSQGYVRYATIAFFILFDIVLFIGLLATKWSYVEVLSIAAIICSGIFLLFFMFSRSSTTDIFGVSVALLFLVTSMLAFMSRLDDAMIRAESDRISMPSEPAADYYDVEYDPVLSRGYAAQSMQSTDASIFASKYSASVSDETSTSKIVESQIKQAAAPQVRITETKITESIFKEPISKRTPEPVMHIRHDPSKARIDRLAAKAVMHELEREARELKDAQSLMKDIEVYDAEKTDRKVRDVEDELLKESSSLEDAQKQIDAIRDASRKIEKAKTLKKELKKEASELLKVQKQIEQIHKLKQASDVKRQAKSLLDAQKEIKRLKAEKDSQAVKKAGKQIEILKKMGQAQELERETRELKGIQRKIDTIKTVKKTNELLKQAKSLKNAEKQVQEVKFLDRQERIVNNAKAIAKAQKKIDEMNKKTRKSLDKQVAKIPLKVPRPVPLQEVKVRTVKASDESFYFSAEGGNKFHEPGCLSIKKVPKNKLTLYTSKKDALKKGLQPCNICIPK